MILNVIMVPPTLGKDVWFCAEEIRTKKKVVVAGPPPAFEFLDPPFHFDSSLCFMFQIQY
jgi:hypothetical protein